MPTGEAFRRRRWEPPTGQGCGSPWRYAAFCIAAGGLLAADAAAVVGAGSGCNARADVRAGQEFSAAVLVQFFGGLPGLDSGAEPSAESQ